MMEQIIAILLVIHLWVSMQSLMTCDTRDSIWVIMSEDYQNNGFWSINAYKKKWKNRGEFRFIIRVLMVLTRFVVDKILKAIWYVLSGFIYVIIFKKGGKIGPDKCGMDQHCQN